MAVDTEPKLEEFVGGDSGECGRSGEEGCWWFHRHPETRPPRTPVFATAPPSPPPHTTHHTHTDEDDYGVDEVGEERKLTVS